MPDRLYALELPSEACSLRLLRGFVQAVLVERFGVGEEPERFADRLVLALDEACSNLVRHRCATIDDGRVRVEIQVGHDAGDETLVFRIPRFCRLDQVDAIRPRTPDEHGGRGLAWVHRIMRRVELVPVGDPAGGRHGAAEGASADRATGDAVRAAVADLVLEARWPPADPDVDESKSGNPENGAPS